MGWASPCLIASTPAMNVVLTAPKPTSSTPNLPFAGAISAPSFMGILRLYLREIGKRLLKATMIHETEVIRTSRPILLWCNPLQRHRNPAKGKLGVLLVGLG